MAVVTIEWPDGVRLTIRRGKVAEVTPPEARALVDALLGSFVTHGGMGDPDLARAYHLLDLMPGGRVVRFRRSRARIPDGAIE